jgi:SAM-dependent methyltransferase
MDEIALLLDLHRDTPRQGPGSEVETRRAIELSGLTNRKGLRIADVGCGSGASTEVLAENLDARIVAVDLLPPFLERLRRNSRALGCSDRIETVAAPMDALPFGEASLDAIWSEGAVYNMGFARGVRDWRRFLKPGGILAVTEIVWRTGQRPRELQDHWESVYPEVDRASTKMAVLEDSGFSPLAYFTLPDRCWLDNYYRPLQERFAAFLSRNDHSPEAQAIVAAERKEIELYESFSRFFGYGFFIARRDEG